MPRPRRSTPPGSVLHVINRGNDRQRLFDSADDYEEFLKLMSWAKARSPVRILAYCVMTNHWHQVLWPESAHAVSAFLHRLCTSHSIRRRKATGTVGDGHIYQSRYHSFAVVSERQYFNVLRYVEGNALRSGLVDDARHWKWSSLAEREGRYRGLLDNGPLPLPPDWAMLVNEGLTPQTLVETRDSFKRTRSRVVRPAVRRGPIRVADALVARTE
jgi:putative transposase